MTLISIPIRLEDERDLWIKVREQKTEYQAESVHYAVCFSICMQAEVEQGYSSMW